MSRRAVLERTLALIAGVALLFLSALLAIHYGQRGYLPLDNSIVFEGGNLLLCGRRPGVDFSAPAGLTLALLQALSFRVFGVSWLAYLVHGALLNATAALTCFALLRPRFPTLTIPMLMAAGTAVVTVPPIGTPYPDHGSFVLAGLAVLLADRASGRGSGGEYLWATCGVVFSAAFLAKQIPAIFVLPLLLMSATRRCGYWAAQRNAAALTAGACLGLLFILVLLRMPVTAFLTDYLAGPLRVGIGRVSAFVTLASPHLSGVVLPVWGVPLGVSTGVLVAEVAWLLKLSRGASGVLKGAVPELLLGLILVIGGFGYALLTFRSAWTSFGWYYMGMGVLLAAPASSLKNRQGACQPDRIAWGKSVLRVSTAILVAHTLWFNAQINDSRIPSLMNLRGRAEAEAVPRGLEWLDPVTPSFTRTNAESLRALISFLNMNVGEVFLLGDSTIVYGLASRCSPSPVLWFHPTLTVPWLLDQGRASEDFEARLEDALVRSGVRFVILENGGTQMGVSPETLPRVSRWVALHTAAKMTFGSFEVFDLRPAAVQKR